MSLSISQLTCIHKCIEQMRNLTTFWLILQEARSKGCFGLLFCKVGPEKLPDLKLDAKDHSVAENINMNIQLINYFFVSFFDFP